MAISNDLAAEFGGLSALNMYQSGRPGSGISKPEHDLVGVFTGNNAANRRQFEQQVFNDAQASIARHFNASEALKNRNFQRDMSNSAVQRRMADLKKAGLNPIMAAMSAKGSADSPSGSAASGSAASASLGQGNKGLMAIVKAFFGLIAKAL